MFKFHHKYYNIIKIDKINNIKIHLRWLNFLSLTPASHRQNRNRKYLRVRVRDNEKVNIYVVFRFSACYHTKRRRSHTHRNNSLFIVYLVFSHGSNIYVGVSERQTQRAQQINLTFEATKNRERRNKIVHFIIDG